ncbi:MAG: hypothetical protein WCW55_00690 [Patescibacteria group bacterium]
MSKLNHKILTFLIIFLVSQAFPAQADLLSDKQQELKNLQKKITEQEDVLAKIRKQKLTLNNQIKLLDQQIEAARLALAEIDTEVVTIGLEKTAINHELVDLEEQALARRLDLKEAIRASYMQSQDSVIEILLSSDSLAGFLTQVEYVDTLQNKITNNLQALEGIKQNLATKKGLLEDKNVRLLEIRQKRVIEENSLGIQANAKEQIMKDLKLSESEYQSKLTEARAEETAINNDIAALLRQLPKTAPVGELQLVWPIPYRRITATFRDADYARTFGLPHNAIDIACPQGTPIKAPADGTVATIKNGGARGLSYMVINILTA